MTSERRRQLLCLALAIAPTLAVAAFVNATSGYVTGYYTQRSGKQSYVLLTHVAYQPDGGEAGGAASFGLMDGGPVMLLGYAKYLPRLMPAQVRREFRTPKPPLDAKQMPRFIMLCVWSLQGDKPGKPLAGYVERDDANIVVSPQQHAISLSARWEPIPDRRAPPAFAERDYCGEIARTGQSSAPLWLLDRNSR